MAFQRVPNGIQAELIFDQYEQTVENVLHFRDEVGDLPVGAGRLAAIGETLAGWWAAELRSLVSSAVTLREVKVTDLKSETGEQASWVDGRAGTNVSPGQPSNVTYCVSLRTGVRGRSYRGRQYFVGLVENQVQGNTLATATATAIAQGYADLQGYLDDAGVSCTWCVLSRETEGLRRPFGVLWPVLYIVMVDNQTDSQRRRLSGRGI